MIELLIEIEISDFDVKKESLQDDILPGMLTDTMVGWVMIWFEDAADIRSELLRISPDEVDGTTMVPFGKCKLPLIS